MFRLTLVGLVKLAIVNWGTKLTAPDRMAPCSYVTRKYIQGVGLTEHSSPGATVKERGTRWQAH